MKLLAERNARRLILIGTVLAVLTLLQALFPPDAHGRPGRPDRIDVLPTSVLEREARKVARNGGIVCHTVGVGAGCASPYMRRLTRELVDRGLRRHGPDARRWGLCVVGRESGFNPAAVSATDDHGAGQLNRPSHRWVDYARIAWPTRVSPSGWASDPVYSVNVFVQLSRGATNRSPWAGGRYSC